MAVAQPESDSEALDKMLRFNDLLDAYGALLTDRQQRLAAKHFQQDLSFSEIAREEGVSRQAAHDAVKHAGLALERFENHLGLVAQRAETPSGPARRDEAAERLAGLIDRLEAMDTDAVNRQWFIAEIGNILEALAPTPDSPAPAEGADLRQDTAGFPQTTDKEQRHV